MMVREKDCVPKPPMLSVAFAVKLNVPDAVGVPLIWPLAGLRLKPPGSAPLKIDHA